MKKGFRVLFALVAIFGLMNCLVLEPALASHQETTCAADDGCDDCFLCCSLYHQTIPVAAIQFEPMNTLSGYIASNITAHFDVPTFSIFHPPLTL